MLDIQKLAAEMGVCCITTYKLDATKSVCPNSESVDTVSPFSEEDTCLNIQNPESESLKTKTVSTNVPNGLESQSNHGAKCKYLYLHIYEPWLCLKCSRIVVAVIQ